MALNYFFYANASQHLSVCVRIAWGGTLKICVHSMIVLMYNPIAFIQEANISKFKKLLS